MIKPEHCMVVWDPDARQVLINSKLILEMLHGNFGLDWGDVVEQTAW